MPVIKKTLKQGDGGASAPSSVVPPTPTPELRPPSAADFEWCNGLADHDVYSNGGSLLQRLLRPVELASNRVEEHLRTGEALIIIDEELPTDLWLFLLWNNHHHQNDPVEWSDWMRLFDGQPEVLLTWSDWEEYLDDGSGPYDHLLYLVVNGVIVSDLAGFSWDPHPWLLWRLGVSRRSVEGLLDHEFPRPCR